MTPRFKQFLKISFSVGLLLWVIKQVDLEQMVQIIQSLPAVSVVLIFLFSLLVMIAAARRSQLVVQNKCGAILSLWEAYRYYLEAAFYGNLLPSAVGGDVWRVYRLNRKTSQLQQAICTVFMERLAGYICTLSLGSIALFILSWQGYHPAWAWLFILLAGVLALGLMVLFYTPFFGLIKGVLQRLGIPGLGEDLESFVLAVQEYLQEPVWLMIIMIWTVLYQIGDIIMVYLLARIIGINLDFIYFLLFIPVVYMVTLLPISFNGLGLRENTLLYLLATVGIAQYKAVLLGLLIYLDRVIKGIIGGILNTLGQKV